MPTDNLNIPGLTTEEVAESRRKYGQNKIEYHNENSFLRAIKSLAKEPMILLLLAASVIYFISGDIGDGIFLTSAIILVATISLYQDSRSRNALLQLKEFSQPFCKVIRGGTVTEIKTEEIVVGDSIIIEEGTSIAADGKIVHANDFSVNESILTGESMPVSKQKDQEDNFVFMGTTVASGLAIAIVTAIGNETKLGKIGKSIENIGDEKTPLELQINDFVKKMVVFGIMVFITVWIINYVHSQSVPDSLLKALTLAMSILPEEIPVAFTTFMALGAWRLMKMGVIVKQMKTVETLGSATVICTDKTGTITENRMSLAKIFVLNTNKIFDAGKANNEEATELIRLSIFASEPIPFDPMEISLHAAYAKAANKDERAEYVLVHEYPLGGTPPMMTHIYENKNGQRIISAKGAPEAFLNIATITTDEREHIQNAINTLTADGYRVLAVGDADFIGNNFPAVQQEFNFRFKGIVAFYDPPKANIRKVLEGFYNAGIAVKIITGDNAATTAAIARQIGFEGYEKTMTGNELMALPNELIREKVFDTNVFTRMFPDAKLKIINALKASNQIVAMTGDGVNDGPALKAAHIGIAMGKKGTEIAKQAASLILQDDDLSNMLEAVAAGRKIYTNLKKAIQYIISIHIPIVLTVFLPLALGWVYPNILSPVHVIFLELIMGPTCSIIYENEPLEKNIMIMPPRPLTSTFFNWKELTTSILQGLVIAAGALFAYQYAIYHHYSEPLTRTMIFLVLIVANILLTLVNRSFYYSVFTTIMYKNNLIALIVGCTIIITFMLIYIKPIAGFFKFQQLTFEQLLICVGIGSVSVIWYELIKVWKRYAV